MARFASCLCAAFLSAASFFFSPVYAQTAASGKSPVIELLAGRRVMVLGDSITQSGQYVSFLEYYLNRQYPEHSFDIVNIGLSSETTSGLSEPNHAGGKFPRPCVHERLGRALEKVRPQVVIACYGMNDGIYAPPDEERMRAFQNGITRLVQECRAMGAQVILVTPPIFEGGNYRSVSSTDAKPPVYEGGYNTVLDQFAAWEKEHPPEGVAAVIDLHSFMAAARAERQKTVPDFKFTRDNIHPKELGHLVMAQAILQALQVPMPDAPAEELLKSAQADPLFALVDQHRTLRSKAWLMHVGYVRERTVAPNSGDLAADEAKAAVLQREIDKLRRSGKQ